MKNQKILIDAFGCDDPDSLIRGIAETLNTLPTVELAVAGHKEKIESVLAPLSFDRSRLEILHAEEIITNNDGPTAAVRTKKNSSLSVACRALKEREDIGAMISAGSTGAVLCASVLLVGKKEGMDRPALACFVPNDGGGITAIADCGASVDCRPEQLLRFAETCNDYMKSVYGLENPRIGLLSVGTEDTKGNEQTKATFKLLKESGLNFVGNMEAKTALSGNYDVIVSDGFSGNVLLKSIEGTAKSVAARMTGYLLEYLPEGTDMTFIKKALGKLFSTLDFNTMGGAVLLGIKKIVIKAHGAATAETVVNTVKQALSMIDGGFADTL